MKFTIRAEEMQSVPTDKGEWKSRRLTLLSSTDELAEQFVEMNLHESHPPIGVGKVVEVRVRKVTGVFQGNARILGDIKTVDGKAVDQGK
jgi:hypothetical protein